jgi:hypothetical protein
MNINITNISYLRDTFLGPISKSIECGVVITPITPSAFQIQIIAPFPSDLHKACHLTIDTSSGKLSGVIVHTRKTDNGDIEFQIDI